MCTVTVVPHRSGIRVICNRDERRARPAALPPQIHDLGRRVAAFPIDPQGGGSWIGVNDAGIVVTLLNVSGPSKRSDQQPKRSRGLIVCELLRCDSLSEVLEAVSTVDAGQFAAFRLVAMHRFIAVEAATDGVRVAMRPQVAIHTPLLFTSSALGDALVEAPRTKLFHSMVVDRHGEWLRGQASFHRHQWASRPEISVRMERDDALTVSRTMVDVTRGGRCLSYEAPVSNRSSREVRTWCLLR
jgi:hypothetical protein